MSKTRAEKAAMLLESARQIAADQKAHPEKWKGQPRVKIRPVGNNDYIITFTPERKEGSK